MLPGLDLYCADPAQHLTTARELDDPDHDLSVRGDLDHDLSVRGDLDHDLSVRGDLDHDLSVRGYLDHDLSVRGVKNCWLVMSNKRKSYPPRKIRYRGVWIVRGGITEQHRFFPRTPQAPTAT